MVEFLKFLPVPPDTSLIYEGSYSPTWVIISVLLAILASYAALSASNRTGHLHNTASKLTWALISAFTLGIGIWAMHFIGMLALSLPCGVRYDPFVTLVSMVPSILASGAALGVAWHGEKRLSLLVRSVLLGAGIGTMHYTGMAAMRLDGFVRYDPSLFVLSIFVAVALSYLALRVKSGVVRLKKRHDALVAVILGSAVSGMHYTAMSAAYFVRGDVAALPASVFTANTLAITVALTTVFLALGALALAAISRNREITDQLRDSEERWKFALEGSGDGMWDWNPQTDEALYSKRWKEMLGYTEDEFPDTGTAGLEHIHPDDKDRVQTAIQECFAGNSFYVVEFRMHCKDGSWKWVLARGKLINRDAEGNPSRMIGTHTDITERKQAEEQLHIAATAFDSQEGMMVTDADGVILRVNRAFAEITGYTAEEAVGQTTRLLKSGRHSADFYREMWETINRTGGWQGEIWDRRKTGEEYPKWLTISAVKDNNGAVTHYVGTHFDITERKKAEERINELAFFDQLTGLPNRTLLLDRLRQIMTASSRDGSYGALLFIDLDNFKTLNDTLGHDMGDLLLKQVAQRLTPCVRKGDSVARLGGDEFVLVLGGLSMSEREAAIGAEAVAGKVLATLNQPYQLGDVAHRCTASVGATLFMGHLATIEDLMKQADLAMYKSKEAGRNTLRFFDPDMETAVMNRAALEKDLREAVREKQFLLHYQAQVVGEGRLTGAEVLVRWQHPQRGMVPPAEFIPLAEETGLILPLGHWVLETACTQLAVWATRPEMAHFTVAVNVSAHQFSQNDFVDQVLAVLNKTGANPQKLKLELTESLLVGNVQNIIEKMFALKSKGVGFSLDDFGTGYSSLSYLKRLPLDQLKIDQSFVRDVLSDPNDAAIAKTIVALAQSLGLGVIAEGVETEAQREFLASSGCHAYQGYFFSRPLPLEGFEEFARRDFDVC
ncbi:EAL domain-containing protein [Sulfuriferula sp.]|uniref:EAL domain-containing protein n=1 Tax=Sulfuriferula sp. TaxID=2025307 RepID=UPI002730072E|nr:EAL domain-containing protein [Sulfuriferula sp.]MDP2025621.1 EAL domain-containing protein [Sulfuriferula sp.]